MWSIVVKAYLVGWDDYGRASDCNPDWEFNWGQSVDLGSNFVVELTANIVEDSYSDRYIRVRRQLSLIWREYNCKALIILQKEVLLLFEDFGHGVSGARA